MEVGHGKQPTHFPESQRVMPAVIAGLEIPETAEVAEATRLIQETPSPHIYHHFRRLSPGIPRFQRTTTVERIVAHPGRTDRTSPEATR